MYITHIDSTRIVVTQLITVILNIFTKRKTKISRNLLEMHKLRSSIVSQDCRIKVQSGLINTKTNQLASHEYGNWIARL